MRENYQEYDLEFCKEKLIPLVKEVANHHLSEAFHVHKKGRGNFVTSVDFIIEAELKDRLRGICPSSGFVAEESGEALKDELNWAIDPIDGTTNFIHGFPFTVSVALLSKTQQGALLGVVYYPKDDVVYYAAIGQGSYRLENETVTQLLIPEDCPEEGVAIFGMPYNRSKAGKILSIAETFFSFSSDLKRIGPSSLDICRVAEGKASLYFELDLKVWDIAAGKLILAEAGGAYELWDDLHLFGPAGSLDRCRRCLQV